MEMKAAWDLICEYVGNLESLADTVDAYRDGEEVIDTGGISVSELEQREIELGGRELIDEAWSELYKVVEPLL